MLTFFLGCLLGAMMGLVLAALLAAAGQEQRRGELWSAYRRGYLAGRRKQFATPLHVIEKGEPNAPSQN